MTGPSQHGEWETLHSLIFILFHNTLQNILLSCWPWLLLTPGFGVQYVTHNMWHAGNITYSNTLFFTYPHSCKCNGNVVYFLLKWQWVGLILVGQVQKTILNRAVKRKIISPTLLTSGSTNLAHLSLCSLYYTPTSLTWHTSFCKNSQLLVSWTFLVQLLNPNVATLSRITFVFNLYRPMRPYAGL
jgi:hypothetical protein